MNNNWVEAKTLNPLLLDALAEYSEEDWYKLNVRANECMPKAMHIHSHERIVINAAGHLVSGFAALYRAIQLDAKVVLHQERRNG
jgi:uridylate kinase